MSTELETNLRYILNEKTNKIIPENIKKDVEILGVTGTYEGSGGASYPPDWSQIGYNTTPQSVINHFNYSKDIYDNWDPNTTSMYQTYRNNQDIRIFPFVDTSKVTTMRQTFYSAVNLEEIPSLNTEEVTNFNNFCRVCEKLKYVGKLSAKKATNLQYMFDTCPSLTNESLNNILEMCAGAIAFTGTKTLAYIGLSSAQATTCTGLSNYAAFTAAGWTTGY